jgi:hypothetical protein
LDAVFGVERADQLAPPSVLTEIAAPPVLVAPTAAHSEVAVHVTALKPPKPAVDPPATPKNGAWDSSAVCGIPTGVEIACVVDVVVDVVVVLAVAPRATAVPVPTTSNAAPTAMPIRETDEDHGDVLDRSSELRRIFEPDRRCFIAAPPGRNPMVPKHFAECLLCQLKY